MSEAYIEAKNFKDSLSDSCMFMKSDMVILCVDDCMLNGNNKIVISYFTQSLADSLEKSEFSDEGSMDRYLGIDVQKVD